MKFKKSIIAGAIALSFVFGGTAGALVYHIKDARKYVGEERLEQVDTFFEEMDFKIKNDTNYETQQEIQRMRGVTESYANEQLGIIYSQELNKKSLEITAETDKAIEEINADVKQYIEKKMKERLDK